MIWTFIIEIFMFWPTHVTPQAKRPPLKPGWKTFVIGFVFSDLLLLLRIWLYRFRPSTYKGITHLVKVRKASIISLFPASFSPTLPPRRQHYKLKLYSITRGLTHDSRADNFKWAILYLALHIIIVLQYYYRQHPLTECLLELLLWVVIQRVSCLKGIVIYPWWCFKDL